MTPKVHCFAGFCLHHLVTTGVHTYAYHYPLFESGMKTSLLTITLCRKDVVLLYEHEEQQ